MTNEEAIDMLVDMDKKTVDEAYAAAQAIKALEKAEKYKWHDLRKDPTDLPEDEHRVLVAYKFWESHLSYKTAYLSRRAYGNVWVEHGNAEFGKDVVIAWRYFEPFEGEEL